MYTAGKEGESMSDHTHTGSNAAAPGLTVAHNEMNTAIPDLADMREAADTLLEDESTVEAILANANVPLIREGGDMYVQRHDLRAYRERALTRRQAGMGEITRLSIAAGLDDVDFSTIERDRA